MYILDFEARYKTDGTETHWVHYAASAGESQMASTWAPVKHFTPRENEADPDVLFRWENFLEAPYNAWIKGHEIPESGTPLSAWASLSREQVEAFRKAGIATVEMISEMNDTVMSKVPLPNMHQMRDQARKFLAARGDAQLVERLDAREAEIAELREQLDQLIADKPKRGRPPKEQAA